MRVRAKLGCLRKSERINQNTIRQEFACWSVNLELPEEGKRDEESGCPVCGCPLGLRLTSVPGAQVGLAVALLLVALLPVALGAAFTFLSASAADYVAKNKHTVARSQGETPTFGPDSAATCANVSYAAFGVAGLLAVGAAVATFLPAGAFVSMGMLVGFSREPSGFHSGAGHRVIEVDPLAERAPAPAG